MINIIIVDDNRVIADTLRIRIGYLCPDLEVAGVYYNAQEALNSMNFETDYIVITDISMPEMNGLMMSEKIMEDGYSAQIIIITGYEKLEYFKWAILNQVVGFILKPIEDEELLSAINTSVERLNSRNSLSELNNTIKTLKVKDNFLHRFEIFYKYFSSVNHNNFDEIEKSVCSMFNDDITDITVFCVTPCPEALLVELKEELLIHILKENPNHAVYENNIIIINNIIMLLSAPAMKNSCNVAESINSYMSEKGIYFKKLKIKNNGNVYNCIIELFCKLHEESFSIKTSFISNNDPESILNTTQSKLKLLISLNMFDEAVLYFIKEFTDPTYYGTVHYLNTLYHKYVDLLMETQQDAAFKLRYTQDALMPLMIYENHDDLLKNIQLVSSQCQKKKKNVGETVVRYINENYTSSLSLNLLAKNVYLHPNYLGNLIREQTGSSFNDYLNSLRVEHAKDILLANPNIKLHELSSHLGYSDTKYFSKVFKKMTGISPSRYVMRS